MFRMVGVGEIYFIVKNVFTSFTDVIELYHIPVEEQIPYLRRKGAFKES